MRLILTITLSALMLSGCMANWPSHRTGPRWQGQPSDNSNANPPPPGGGGCSPVCM
jgi:hypothetical protein